MQLQSPPLPKEMPLLHPLSLPQPPQRNKRIMIQIQELHPPLFLSVTQPQSLLQQRAISLIEKPPKNYLCYSVCQSAFLVTNSFLSFMVFHFPV